MKPTKWQLVSAEDISPSKWFPLERRVYKLPNGTIVEDFTVTTLDDFSMIIPVTVDKKIVFVNQYKPGVDEVILQFPAGRSEPKYESMHELARHELEEEVVGIKAQPQQLTKFARFNCFSTKASEVVHMYLAVECEFNSKQNLDSTENIEVVAVTPHELDELVLQNKIWCSQSAADWELTKKKFPDNLADNYS